MSAHRVAFADKEMKPDNINSEHSTKASNMPSTTSRNLRQQQQANKWLPRLASGELTSYSPPRASSLGQV